MNGSISWSAMCMPENTNREISPLEAISDNYEKVVLSTGTPLRTNARICLPTPQAKGGILAPLPISVGSIDLGETRCFVYWLFVQE